MPDLDIGARGRGGTRFALLENPVDSRMPPSMPRRPKPPGIDGAVVPSLVLLADAMLARAFDPSAPAPPEPADVLLPFVPGDAKDPRELLERTAAALAAAPPETLRESPWIPAYAEDLRGRARRWSPGACEAIVPVVRDAPATDGSLDDRAWGYAAVRRAAGVEVLLLSDGRDLHVGLRFPASLGSSVGLEVESDSRKAVPMRDGRASDSEGTEVRSRDAAGTRTVEARVDGDTFGGDVCPGRVLRLRLKTAASPGAAVECRLVVGR